MIIKYKYNECWHYIEDVKNVSIKRFLLENLIKDSVKWVNERGIYVQRDKKSEYHEVCVFRRLNMLTSKYGGGFHMLGDCGEGYHIDKNLFNKFDFIDHNKEVKEGILTTATFNDEVALIFYDIDGERKSVAVSTLEAFLLNDIGKTIERI